MEHDDASEESVETGPLLTLQEAADRLAVHYMTAYRWVRRGDLPAFKAGGRLRVRVADVEHYLHAREVDVVTPSGGAQNTDWARHTQRLVDLLIDGRATEAGALARKVGSDGAPAADIYVHLLTPALHEIGERWSRGLVGIAIEHRATEIARTLMARLGESFRRRGPERGSAVSLALAGDLHALPSAMVADFLRAGGWDVHNLGADLPAPALASFLGEADVDAVVISVTNAELGVQPLRELAEVARTDAPQRIVVAGGQGIDAALAEQAGIEHVGDVVTLAGRLDELLATSSR